MRTSQTFLTTLRDVPAEAQIASHQLMLRASMLRKLGNGLFAYLPLGLRSLRKVEAIVRQEMDALGALEVKPSVVVPGELWKESGRWQTMGESLLRVKNRLGNDLVVSPTAEEVFTALVRDELSSWRQLPLVLYQINTKYRDEIRPRYGVMRGREFTMKDAYSFHADEASLQATYDVLAAAYRRIFRRCGLSVIPVKADTGAMGGSASEEFMVESTIGDNTLVLCDCGYAANDEKAVCRPDAEEGAPSSQAPEAVATPGHGSIADVSRFLGAEPRRFLKTLIYRALNVELDLAGAPGCGALKPLKAAPEAPALVPEAFFAVVIRGDLDVNETKLAAALQAGEVALASEADVRRLTGADVGFAGPVGFTACPVVCDQGALAVHDAITGGLATDVHLVHVEPGRDFTPWLVADLRTVRAGDLCAPCGRPLKTTKGNELGHIFQLGRKYTQALGASFLDANGRAQTPTMGCYGVGIDRTLASVIEEHHDDDGIVWPMSLAPYQVIVVPIGYEGDVKAVADAVHDGLMARGVEVLLDDRNERPGVKFKDADLLGIPLRVTVGAKNLPGHVEVRGRRDKVTRLVAVDAVVAEVEHLVRSALAELEG